jgi:stress response protein YsnF
MYEAGEKAGSTWQKIVNFFEGKSNDESTSRAATANRDDMSDRSYGGYDYDREQFRGSLNQLNVPEQHSRYFTHQFGQGEEGALVTVSAAGRESEAETILEQNDGDIGRNATDYQYPQETGTSNRDSATQRIQLLGEVLKVHKDRVSRGDAVLRKEVVTENQTIQVPVEREELVVTRKPVSGEETREAGGISGKTAKSAFLCLKRK